MSDMSSSRDNVEQSIEQHSKSFALASKLLPVKVRAQAVVLYAYCRRADDAIDLCAPADQPAQLAQLRAELDRVYAGERFSDPLLARFQAVVQECAVPRVYVDELLAGMEMDVLCMRYRTLAELQQYAYRVAGVVGLMMCHVMGVRTGSALRHAAHLGMAMQLSNIARDVQEDWSRARLYLPEELLARCGAAGLDPTLGPLPRTAAASVARATELLLRHADAYYRSGDAGLPLLSPRCALAIRAARLVYSEISTRVRAQGCDPFAPRAVVSKQRKLALVARAAWLSAQQLPSALLAPPAHVPATSVTDPQSLFSVSS